MYDEDGNLIESGSVVTEGDLIEFKIEYTILGQQLGVMNGESITVRQGETILVPASVTALQIVPEEGLELLSSWIVE